MTKGKVTNLDDIIITGQMKDSKFSSNKNISNHTVATEEISELSFSFISENSDQSGCSWQNSVSQPQHKLLEIQDGLKELESQAGRSIRFSNQVKYHDIVHRLDYSQKERSACWYTKSDILATRKDAQTMINLLESGSKLPPGADFPTLRGLENLTKQGNKVACQNHSLAIEAVLFEQLEQDLAGIHDEKAIATKYRQISLRCRFPARLRALQDQESAIKKQKPHVKSTPSSSDVRLSYGNNNVKKDHEIEQSFSNNAKSIDIRV